MTSAGEVAHFDDWAEFACQLVTLTYCEPVLAIRKVMSAFGGKADIDPRYPNVR